MPWTGYLERGHIIRESFTQTGFKYFAYEHPRFVPNLTNLEAIFDQHKNIDIFLLSETHLNDDNSKLYEIPGYSLVYKNRKHSSSGGVVQLISQKDLLGKEERIWREIKFRGGSRHSQHGQLTMFTDHVYIKTVDNFILFVCKF